LKKGAKKAPSSSYEFYNKAKGIRAFYQIFEREK
jgi:hypothetical protein